MEGALAVAEECRHSSSNGEFTPKAIRCDVTNEVEVRTMVETAVNDHGRVDYYVHSAGVCCPHPLVLRPRLCPSHTSFHEIRLTHMIMHLDGQHRRGEDTQRQYRSLLPYYGHQRLRPHALLTSGLERDGKARTSVIRKPPVRKEKSRSRLNCHYSLRKLIRCNARYDGLYGIETRRERHSKDCRYVAFSLLLFWLLHTS